VLGRLAVFPIILLFQEEVRSRGKEGMGRVFLAVITGTQKKFSSSKSETYIYFRTKKIVNFRFMYTKALFRCEKNLDFATVALSFVCGKYCPIID